LPDKYKSDDSSYFRASGYATGVDSHFTVNTNTNENITFGYDYEGPLPKITAISSPTVPGKVYMDVGNVSIGDFFLTQYVHVTANTLPPAVLTEAFVDDFGYT